MPHNSREYVKFSRIGLVLNIWYHFPEINVPVQVEQGEFNTIWQMLVFEKKIDFKVTSAHLNVPKYNLFRAIYKILADTPIKFTFTKTSIDLLEEKDLEVFFTAFKKAFSQWQSPESIPPVTGGN